MYSQADVDKENKNLIKKGIERKSIKNEKGKNLNGKTLTNIICVEKL